MKKAPLNTRVPFFYTGPDWEKGPLPAVFYFAISAEESLSTIPYANPVHFLGDFPVRIFSCDLPFHGKGLIAKEAMGKWAQSILEGKDIARDFLCDLIASMEELISLPEIDKSKIGIMGLSRGGFIAGQVAAAIEEITALVCFAPLIEFSSVLEFTSLAKLPLVQPLSLFSLTEPLCQKAIKTFIGGNDQRVHTDLSYKWTKALISRAEDLKIRSPQIELAIKPSIGHAGHGTSDESFKEGALWLWHKLKGSS